MTPAAHGTARSAIPGRSRLAARLGALLADASGSAAVVAAIAFPVVIGGMGLGAETGYWYLSQRKLQHAADVSAHAGGVRLRAGDTATQIGTATLNIATLSGLSTSVGTIVVNIPPLTGARAGATDSIEVIVTEVQPRLFSAVFSQQPVTIRARAVATIAASSRACVLALSPVASGAITITGSTSLTLAGCDVVSNSNAADSILMSGSGTLTTGCLDAVGVAVTTSNLTLTQCTAAKSYSQVVRDPYAAVAEPSVLGACKNNHVGTTGSPTTLTPTDNQPNGVKSMRFCSGLDAKGAVTFSPGVYIIEGGGLTINGGAQLLGSGVTFFFVNGGNLSLGSNGSVNLSAPTSGPYSGILFFGSRATAGTSQTITGNSGSTLQGAVYLPKSNITFTGNSSTTESCTQVIGLTVTFTGNSSLGSSCSTAGTSIVPSNEGVVIVE